MKIIGRFLLVLVFFVIGFGAMIFSDLRERRKQRRLGRDYEGPLAD